jgi:hypothetical protein
MIVDEVEKAMNILEKIGIRPQEIVLSEGDYNKLTIAFQIERKLPMVGARMHIVTDCGYVVIRPSSQEEST